MFSQVPPSLRVMQDVPVLPTIPPQIVFSVRLWPSLMSPGISGSRQCWSVEGTNTSTDVDDSPPAMINPKYNIIESSVML